MALSSADPPRAIGAGFDEGNAVAAIGEAGGAGAAVGERTTGASAACFTDRGHRITSSKPAPSRREDRRSSRQIRRTILPASSASRSSWIVKSAITATNRKCGSRVCRFAPRPSRHRSMSHRRSRTSWWGGATRPRPAAARVVLDLERSTRYSVFTLYNPYRCRQSEPPRRSTRAGRARHAGLGIPVGQGRARVRLQVHAIDPVPTCRRLRSLNMWTCSQTMT